MKNVMDSRNRDAKEIVVDLAAMGSEPCRLVVVGSRGLNAGDLAAALREQWSSIVDLVGFEPRWIVTGCAPVGAEKAARLAARSVTGRRAAVFHRPELVNSAKTAEMFMNILLAKTGDAALILAAGARPTCANLRLALGEWGKKAYQVEVG